MKPSLPDDKSGFERYTEDLQEFLRFEREGREMGRLLCFWWCEMERRLVLTRCEYDVLQA